MTRPPKLASTTYGKGSAAKQDALRKGKVAASKAKLDALIARQEAEAAEIDTRGHWHGGPAPCPVCGGQRPA